MESGKETFTEDRVIERDGENPTFPFLSRAVPGSAGRRHFVSRREFMGSALLSTAGAMFSHARKPPRWQMGCYTRPWAQYD